MKFFDSTGREVDIVETDGGYEEAHVVHAIYLDVEEAEDVPNNELDYLTEAYNIEIADGEYQKMVGAAEDAFEGDR